MNANPPINRLDLSKWTSFRFPRIMRSIKCPTCKQRCKGMMTRSWPDGSQQKWLMPCSHELNPEQEDAIVLDMLKRSL